MSDFVEEAAAIAEPVFKQQGWKWYRCGGDGVPTRDEIVEAIDTMLRHAGEGSGYYSTGRIAVYNVVDLESGTLSQRIFLELGSQYTDLPKFVVDALK